MGGFADIEFAVLTGLVDGYILGPKAVGLGKNAAAHYPTAVMCQAADAQEILRRAAAAFAQRENARIRPDDSLTVVPMHSLEKLSEIAAKYEKVAVIGGGANIKLTVGGATVDLIRALTERGIACFVFGSAIIEAAKAGLSEHVYASGASVGDIVYHEEIRSRTAVACMPELCSGMDLARALHMGVHGLKVFTCTELPVEGCPPLADEIHRYLIWRSGREYVAAVLEALC